MLWPSVSEAFQALQTGEVCLEVRDEISSFTPQLLRLKQPAIPEILQTDQAVMVVHNQQNINPGLNHRLEIDIGTLAHRYMEIIAQQGVATWPIGRISALKNVMQHWFGQQGHVLSIAKEGAQNVADMLMRTLDSEDGQWILKDRAISGAELAMTKIIGQEIKNYIVDRTFVEAGVRWIIDYKTTGITDNASFDMFVSAAEVYRKQLEDYATLFAYEGLEVKCAIFFMSAAKLVQLQVQTEAT
jgi:ATP-dependent exoDNAse (exonuclease V) beta subunit